ncbi:hypothetical protein HYC85_000796 [Camellia sinensis]|uniref:Uncharacterized protein n=1 Tax=Camellia sinensis TaxID=4442 RepID=A0A7J7I4N9_CAMSI|nr:hypothetical protein HYC85_000796 [Camellia sinensis]
MNSDSNTNKNPSLHQWRFGPNKYKNKNKICTRFCYKKEKKMEKAKEKGKTLSFSLNPFLFFLISRITILAPADEHGDTAPHDVEPSSLFFDKPSTFSCERTPSL